MQCPILIVPPHANAPTYHSPQKQFFIWPECYSTATGGPINTNRTYANLAQPTILQHTSTKTLIDSTRASGNRNHMSIHDASNHQKCLQTSALASSTRSRERPEGLQTTILLLAACVQISDMTSSTSSCNDYMIHDDNKQRRDTRR